MRKELDFSKMANESDIINIEDKIKGVIVLLHSLASSDDVGTHQYQRQAYNTLASSLYETLKDFKNTKDGIDYMQNIIRNLEKEN